MVAFPPTTRPGTSASYKRLHANVEWQEPAYRLWDPKDIEGWLGELRELGVPHCVFVDHEIEGQMALARFTKPRARPINLYGTGKRSSLRARRLRVQPFRYEAVEPGELGRDSTVALAPIDNARFNFLRERYLAKGIDFADGMYPYAVLLDGKLAGGFCLTRENTGRRDSIYLLSDFSIRRERRLGKLMAMVATSGDALQTAERRLLLRFSKVRTSVFTDKPVSMKYRGIFELEARREGFLNYVSDARRVPLADIYREWFDRYAAHRA